MLIQAEIKNLIFQALQLSGFQGDIHLEHPDDFSHGDFSTNIAMVLAKSLGKNPKVLAEEIRKHIPSHEYVSSVGVAGPGFINFHLSKTFFRDVLSGINTHVGKSDMYKDRRILVEHSSPNLFKPFHIGHMMNNAIGESIARLAEYSGATVTKMSFPSDISLGIAKAIFVLLEQKVNISSLTIEILGAAYVEGTKRYEEDESIHDRVKEIADNLYTQQKDSPEYELFEVARSFNIRYFEDVTNRLGSHFDNYIYESEAGEVGTEIVRKHTPEIFTESDGAIVYVPDEKDKHLNTSVFINSQGNPTYEAKDLGLLSMKFDRFNPDVSLFVTDYQQVPHFNVVLDAAQRINHIWKERSFHIPHGRMSFRGEKMSSRLGNVPLVTDILQVVVSEVVEKTKDRILVDVKEDINAVAIAALKFTILKAEAGKSINFDPETSLSFEGDSGPYLQYTIARCNSLLEKARAEGFSVSETPDNSWTPGAVEKTIYQFPEVVEYAIVQWAPHHVANYLLELARAFNSWYGSTKVLDKENPNAGFSLFLVEKTALTLRNGLYLLGIKSPEKM